MKAEEIRQFASNKKGGWHGWPIHAGSDGARDGLLMEIAAQLAELNQHMQTIAETLQADGMAKYGK